MTLFVNVSTLEDKVNNGKLSELNIILPFDGLFGANETFRVNLTFGTFLKPWGTCVPSDVVDKVPSKIISPIPLPLFYLSVLSPYT